MRFEFATATRIVFGLGSLEEVAPTVADFGSRALIVLGVEIELAHPLLAGLAEAGVISIVFSVHHEPTVDIVQEGVKLARKENCDLVVGFGGGSALDAGKAIAALSSNPGDVFEYLEVVGDGRELGESPLAFIAIPTTAGTGSEVTRNAVIGLPEYRVKVSLRNPKMLPCLAVVDPELTYSLPSDITATTGLDALTQLIEPYVSNRANPLTNAFCREGMRRVARSLRPAFENGLNKIARQDMSLASLFGGLALANAGLGAVHGFAGPLGGMYPATHGAICARLLPYVMEINIRAMKQREPDNPALQRYEVVAQILTGDRNATTLDGVSWVNELSKDLHIQPLSVYGINRGEIPTVIKNAERASSMKGNPIHLKTGEMVEILLNSL